MKLRRNPPLRILPLIQLFFKLVKFASGGGKTNLKLLAVYSDGLAIWDLKEMEIVNELRSPRVIPEVSLLLIRWRSGCYVLF